MIPSAVRIFVCSEPQDMRRSFDRLAQEAKEYFDIDPQYARAACHFAHQRGSPDAYRESRSKSDATVVRCGRDPTATSRCAQLTAYRRATSVQFAPIRSFSYEPRCRARALRARCEWLRRQARTAPNAEAGASHHLSVRQ